MSAEQCRSAYRARWNKCVRSLKALDFMLQADPDLVIGTDIADLRARVEDLTQCFHEFNAYKNAYTMMTVGDSHE